MRRKLVLILALSFILSGCTIGPTVQTEFIIVKPGVPLQVMERRTVKVRLLKDNRIGEQDIGGWVAMPEEYWNLIVKKLGEKEVP